MNPWVLVGFGVLVISTALGSFHVGQVYERAGFIEADLRKAEKVIVKQVEVIREVPKIVTKVVTREVEVVKEIERVSVAAQTMLSPDCVMPDSFGLLLVAAANGVDPASPDALGASGSYDCIETITAILTDLRDGYKNTARLAGLQEWAKLVTSPAPSQ